MQEQYIEYWHIVLWENCDGICRVEKDILKKMKRKEKFNYNSLNEKMVRYTANPIEDIKYHEDLEKVKSEENMWELKFHLSSRNEIRFLGCLALETGTPCILCPLRI